MTSLPGNSISNVHTSKCLEHVSDVDECSSDLLNRCAFPELCVNTVGTFTCSCPEDYKLMADGFSCQRKSCVEKTKQCYFKSEMLYFCGCIP